LPSWASPLQGSLSSRRGTTFPGRPSPPGLSRPAPRRAVGRLRAPSGSCRRGACTFLLRGSWALLRFSTLSPVSKLGSVFVPGCRRRFTCESFDSPPRPLSLEPRGGVAAPLRALFGTIHRNLARALRDGASR
jgi:hypothetical protein